jgi:hypothetical protein
MIGGQTRLSLEPPQEIKVTYVTLNGGVGRITGTSSEENQKFLLLCAGPKLGV